MSSIDYYNNSDDWGNHQYSTLDEIINNYMMGRDSDDFTGIVPRYKVLYQAKRGIRELYSDVVREIRAVELELSPTLMVVVPPDFVNYVRISWVDERGQLHPMAIDRSLSLADVYLQDSSYNLLFDSQGNVIKDDGLSEQTNFINDDKSSKKCYRFCNDIFTPNVDLSKVYTNGKFNYDKANGIIQFGSDVFGKHVVIEYISDGLYTGAEGRSESNIRIHKFAETALLDYIYYELIKNRRSVPMNEKMRARKEYYNSKRLAKRRINSININDLMQVFKGTSKWVKQ